MARAGRLAGAILVEGEGACFLVGNPKEPCDFARAGFEAPPAIDAVARPFVRLGRCGPGALAPPVLDVPLDGEATAALAARRFLIERNGSVSERLWRLVVGDARGAVDARWLAEVPDAIWSIVREAVLRCS